MRIQKFQVPALAWFGRKQIELDFPSAWKVAFFPMNGFLEPKIGDEEIKNALRKPIGTKPLVKIAKGKEEAVIVVDDMTRPTRVYEILPNLLHELKQAGISDENIRFIMAGGLHGAWYRDDFVKKIGAENVEKYPVYNHNPFDNCERMGYTERGTPLEINAEYIACDLKIGIGLVVPHPTTGYGGGAKMVLPGISSFNSIYNNHIEVHRKNPPSEDGSHWGYLRRNVTRADIEEAGKLAGMDMKIDVLVNGFGDSSRVFAGDVHKEFLKAAEYARNHYSTQSIPEKTDVIIANTYAKANEATLALANWNRYMNEESVMVIITHAPEGQTTHYLLGKFGKDQLAPGVQALRKIRFKKLIIFSEYKTPDPFLPITKSEVTWIGNWKEVIEELRASFDHEPRVAILPNSEIQCSRQRLIQSW